MNKYRLLLLLGITALGLSSCKHDNAPREMKYGGVSFQYPRNWSNKTYKPEEGKYYIYCEQRIGHDMIDFSISNTEDIELEDFMDTYLNGVEKKIEKMTEGPLNSKYRGYITIDSLENSKYAGYECIKKKFKGEILNEGIMYGTVYIFYAEGKTLRITTLSTDDQLKYNFELIENSFKVDPLQ